MYSFLKKKQSLSRVIFRLLKALGVKANEESIRQVLEAHPAYPSLLAVNDCLSWLNVRNQAFNIPKNAYDVEDLLFPFLAHLKEDGGRFIVIHDIHSGSVSYSDENTAYGNILERDFLDRWDGIALHAEKTENSGEKDYNMNSLKYFLGMVKWPLGLAVFMATLYLGIFHASVSTPIKISIMLKALGFATSILLLIQSIDSNNSFVRKFCQLGNKNDCNSILNSNAASITSWLSWSEVGLFYFSGSLLCLVFNPGAIPLILILNILALPCILYSIIFQFRIKQWCMLCCVVQLILFLEFFNTIFLQFSILNSGLSIGQPLSFAICFLLPVIIWSIFKPLFSDAAQANVIKQELKYFKFNNDLFLQSLMNQPKYAIDDKLMPITLGNPKAQTVITMVTNPVCAPCARSHKELDRLLSIRGDLQVKLIFSIPNIDSDIKTKVARHLTAFSNHNDLSKIDEALKYWFDGKGNYDKLRERFPASEDSEMLSAMENQAKWCTMADITFTPTILINGHKLPNPYRLEDMHYLLG